MALLITEPKRRHQTVTEASIARLGWIRRYADQLLW
jgi:hypothetical protein